MKPLATAAIIEAVPYIALTAALWIFGEPALWAWGWPIIGCTLAIVGIRLALFYYGAGLRFYPRTLRLRFELEDAAFFACKFARDGAYEQEMSQRLRSAAGLARRGALGDRIGKLLKTPPPTDPAERRAIAEELHAIVKDLSNERGRRYPLRVVGMLPENCFLPASAAFALLGTMIEWPAPAPDLLTTGGLLKGLVLFALADAILRLGRWISLKLHDIRSKASFRTIVVSDGTSLSTFGTTAALYLYWRIGHLVLLLDDTLEKESNFVPPPGAYTIYANSESFSDALTAFGESTDLIVLDTTDDALAAKVREMTRLPTSRYLALGNGETVPKGYRWVDPRCLYILPSDKRTRQPDVDSYRLGFRPDRPWWTGRLFQLELFASVVLASVDRGLPLALFFALAALGEALPTQLWPRRRASVSRSTLRVPRAPDLSHRLNPRKLAQRLWLGAIIVSLAASAYLWWPLLIRTNWQDGLKDPIWLVVAALLYACTFACNSIVNAGLIGRKWSLDWNFRFLVLRRNSRKYGYGHKAFVMLTCGKYGQVISLLDYSLEQTDDDTGEWRESSLGSWFPLFSEVGATLKPDIFLHNWQRQVILELETVDFAVFDWVEEVTDNMRWELGAALERLPSHRILVVCSPATESDLDSYLGSLHLLEIERPRSLVAARGRDDEYIWADHGDFDKAFSGCLHRLLSELRVEPRKIAKRDNPGAWPYPLPGDETGEPAETHTERAA